jgi:hypothetical protein
MRMVMQRLGDLREDMVLVGGMAAAMLVTDAGAQEARITNDVDLIIEVTSRLDYYEELQQRLRALGFREDTRENAPICRWLLDGQAVDIMPTDPDILGFSNAWYSHAIATAQRVMLESTEIGPLEIKVASAPAFLATKLASFASRGNGDLLHADIEDIVSLIDGRAALRDEVLDDVEELRTFIESTLAALVRDGLEDHIASHLPGDMASQARQPIVVERLRRIAGLTARGR